MPGYHGLIQHCFALRNHESCQPFEGASAKAMVRERFEIEASADIGFAVSPIEAWPEESPFPGPSPLLRNRQTTLDPHGRGRFVKWGERGYAEALPKAFDWADGGECGKLCEEENHWERLIFAKRGPGTRTGAAPELNDFLIKENGGAGGGPALGVSEALWELLATRRSMLFGLSLANRFVNVVLPHAFLTPAPEDAQCQGRRRQEQVGPWILQPVVSLIRVDGSFRRTYSLSAFLIPVKGSACGSRKMAECEIKEMVDAGWALASSVSRVPRFNVSGPLLAYLSRLAPAIEPLLPVPDGAPDRPGQREWRALGLRELTELIAFGVGLRMAQGSSGRSTKRVGQEIGDGVLTSLGNSRVSSVLVVDKKFDKPGPDDHATGMSLPGSLGSLVPTLAGKVRIPKQGPIDERHEYRLDRGYIDHGEHAIAVLPSSRSLVVTSDAEAQWGRWESGLMQAGWVAYTVIAAASAIGAIRAVNQDLEIAARSDDPGKIVQMEHDVSVDLHELYDLDITWEAYRLRYRRLRKKLGITGDYEALRNKLEALYRETSTHFEARTQSRLVVLTAAIVALSVLILAGTIVLVVKPG